MLKRIQVAVLVGLVVILPGPAQARADVLMPAEARADVLMPAEARAATAAFKAIDRDNWKRAQRPTARITDPLVVKIIR